jgi:alpha-mannosidase
MRGVQRLEVDTTPGARPDLALPTSLSLVHAEDDRIVLSAVKRSEDGEWLVVRLLNQSDDSVSTSVRFPFPLADVQSARLDESFEKQLQSPEHGRVVLSFAPWRIQTLKVKPASAPSGPAAVPVLHQESEPF